jgi:hypothetical protein
VQVFRRRLETETETTFLRATLFRCVGWPRILVRLGAFEMNKPVPFDIVLLVISAARCSGNPHKVSLRLSASFVAASAQSTMIDIWRLKKDYNAY